MAMPKRRPRPPRSFAPLGLPVLLIPLLFGCGDGIPNFTPEELAEATAQVKEAFQIQDYEFGGELGRKWASWAPDAMELKAWTVANLAKENPMGTLSVDMAEEMVAADSGSAWSSFALAGARLWTYPQKKQEEALQASEKALAGFPDLVEAVVLRGEALSLVQDSDSALAFLETLPKELQENPDVQCFRALELWPLVSDPSDSLLAETVSFYEEILQKHPSHISSNVDAAIVFLFLAGEPERALPYLERAAASTPSPKVHGHLWQAILSGTDLPDEEKAARIETDLREILETAGESPARWAALAAALGDNGLSGLQAEIEERVLEVHPKSQGAEMILGNRFRSLAGEIWEAPLPEGEKDLAKRERLAAMLGDFIDRREIHDPGLLLEAQWDLFLLRREDPNPDPEILKNLASRLVSHMETTPGSSPSAYYSVMATSLVEQAQASEEAKAMIDTGLAKLEARVAEENAEAEAETEEEEVEASEESAVEEEPVVGEAEIEADHADADEGEPDADTADAEKEEDVDPRVKAERAMFAAAMGLVLLEEGAVEEAEEELTQARDLDPESYYSMAVLPYSYLYSGRLMEKKAELARAAGDEAEAGELQRTADDFYQKGLRLEYYPSPLAGQPWINPNETAIESLYQTMHGDLEGFDDYLLAVKEEEYEERRSEILDQRIEDPEPMVAFALETLEGEAVNSESLLGKVLVINFWGTW